MDNTIISRQVSAGTRVYYIDAHLDRTGQPFVEITEIVTNKLSKRKKLRKKQLRFRLIIHSANIDRFCEALNEVVGHIKENGTAL